MPTELKTTERLIRDIAALMVSKPDALQIGSQSDGNGTGLIAMKCAEEDEGILVGKGGSHVKAFAYIVERIGLAKRKELLFKLKTSSNDGGRLNGVKPAKDHDTGPAADLIIRIMEQLSIKAEVKCELESRDQMLSFVFTAIIPDHADQVRIFSQSEGGTPLVGHIATLFRAIAMRHGVLYSIDVEAP